jgi:hypothetical protein
MDAWWLGWLVFASVATFYCVEIVSQLPLLARYLRALPPLRRAALPRHPRDPRWAVFGSTRFFLAVFRDALTDGADDSGELKRVKRHMRWTAVRELFGALATVGTWLFLRSQGWEPWPR